MAIVRPSCPGSETWISLIPYSLLSMSRSSGLSCRYWWILDVIVLSKTHLSVIERSELADVRFTGD